MFRYRKNAMSYRKASKDKGCPFCDVHDKDLIVEGLPTALVIRNIYPYDLWEFREVEEHFMVIPKRHVKSLNDLKPDEIKDVVDLISRYEEMNFNVYARAVESVQRTVPLHQHTHLIKTGTKQARGGLFLKKPYFLVKY